LKTNHRETSPAGAQAPQGFFVCTFNYIITLKKLSLARQEAWQGGHDREDFVVRASCPLSLQTGSLRYAGTVFK
jgi:hypothetical protein